MLSKEIQEKTQTNNFSFSSKNELQKMFFAKKVYQAALTEKNSINTFYGSLWKRIKFIYVVN